MRQGTYSNRHAHRPTQTGRDTRTREINIQTADTGSH